MDKHDAAPDGGDLTAEESAALEAMQNDGAPPEPTPEPVAEQASKPAAEPEPDKPSQERPPEGHVPHGAMHAERVRRQEAERKLAALEERMEKYEAAQPKPEPEPIPDPVMEPEKYNAWVTGLSNKTVDEVRQLREQLSETQQRQRVEAVIGRSEEAFAKDKPDYYDALNHVIRSREAEFEMWGATPEEAQEKVQEEVWQTAQNAIRMGVNPAEMAYRIATTRGYRPAQNPAPAAEKVAALAKAQDNASSLAGTGGPASGGGMTVEDMANMSQAQIDKLSDDEIRRAMGG